MTDIVPGAAPGERPLGAIGRLNEFLDQHVLPYPVKYLTNRITILGTLTLLIPLILFANVTVFVLLANSYLNVMSVVVSSTVLLYSTLAEARDRVAAQRREEIAAAHEKLVEQRAEADHKRIQEIHDHLDEIHKEMMEHVTQSLDRIEKMMVDRLETLQEEDHNHISDTHNAVMQSIAAHKEELADMRQMLALLRPTPPESN
ncbi:MAG TPA: hypothetical protein VMT34_02085 [Aggregatilineales bacterium]|nr:hypothetical protein [Aggregatilineales bacterium]